MVLLVEWLSLSHRQTRASTMTELQALVRAAQDGDKDAFGQVVMRFQDMAYASAYATVGDACLAQDIAQESFLDAYLNLSKLRDPAAFPGWFRRIVIGHSNRQRRGQPVTTVSLDDAGSLYTHLPDPALCARIHMGASG